MKSKWFVLNELSLNFRFYYQIRKSHSNLFVLDTFNWKIFHKLTLVTSNCIKLIEILSGKETIFIFVRRGSEINIYDL